MGGDTTVLAGLLKEHYQEKIKEQINQDTTALDLFKNGDSEGMEVGGKYVAYPVHLARNTGAGSIGEDKTLPVAGNQTLVQVNIAYKSTYGRFRLTGQIIEAAKKSKGAFKKSVGLEMDGLVNDVARVRNRQLFGYSVGIMAKVRGSNASGTTVNIKDAGGVAYNDAGGTAIGAGRYLQVGDYVVFVCSATPLTATDADIVSSSTVVRITAISDDGNTLTVHTATGATLNDGDLVVLSPAQSATESSLNREPMGLLGLVDDATYLTTLHGISRSTYPAWKGTVRPINGDFSSNQLSRAENLSNEKAGKARKRVLLSHSSVKQQYIDILQGIKRFVNDGTKMPSLGNELDEVKWNNSEWRVDRMCPYGMIFGVSTEEMIHYVNSPGEFWDMDGSVFGRVTDKDAVEGRWRIIDNFTTDVPAKNFRLDGITATVDYTQVV